MAGLPNERGPGRRLSDGASTVSPELTQQQQESLARTHAVERGPIHDLIVELYRGGASLAQIAAEAGAHYHTVVAVLRDRGVYAGDGPDRYHTSRRGVDSPALKAARKRVAERLQQTRHERVSAYQSGVTISELAVQAGISEKAMREYLIEHGCDVPDLGSWQGRFPELADRDQVYRWYVRERRTLADIAADVGTTASTVAAALEHHGIARRPRGTRSDERQRTLKRRLAAIADGTSVEELAALEGVAVSSLRMYLQRAGVDVPDRGSWQGRFPELLDGEMLRRLYAVEGLSTTALCRRFGCSPGVLRKAMDHHNIPRRPPGGRRHS